MEKEDYLETIYKLKKENQQVRVSDLAGALGVSKPSVTQMIQRLHQEGLVVYRRYLTVNLTPKGRKIGKVVADRHEVLADFFTFLGIPQHIQEKDIHGIEHHLSPVTLEKLRNVTQFLKNKTSRRSSTL